MDEQTTPVSLPAPYEPYAQLIPLVVDGLSSDHSRRAYSTALKQFFSWVASQDHPQFSKQTVQAYASSIRHLAPSTINLRLSAVRRLALEAADAGLLPLPIAQAINRIRGAKSSGVRSGNWLTREQALSLLQAPDPGTLRGLRDRALLALLVGCGVRREEVSALRPGDVQQREGRWVLADIRGKGRRVRTVPIPPWAKVAIDRWLCALGDLEKAGEHPGTSACAPPFRDVGSIGSPGGSARFAQTGPVRDGASGESIALFLTINKSGKPGSGRLKSESVYRIVRGYAAILGLQVAPHDLRRTFARLAKRGGAETEQIQFSLGHSSLQTTERYLGSQQDLTNAPCDVLGLGLPHDEKEPPN